MLRFIKWVGSGVKGTAAAAAKSRPGQYFLGGSKGLVKGAFLGGGIAFSNMSYGDTLGTGGATLYGAIGALPYIGKAIILGELAHTALEYGNKYLKESRKVEFGRPIEDPFGTASTMRQRSASNLSRGRAVLGQEARMYHF